MSNERLLPIKHGYNFRELGGYQTSDGKTIKAGRLIRSDRLAQLDQQDEQVLTRIPVTVDIDFRSKREATTAPDRVPATARYYNLPVFDADVTNASRSDEEIARDMQTPGNGFRHMVQVYSKMPKQPSAKRAYQELFHLLLTTEKGAVLFHCTAGKDRTGFGAYLILTALGVPRETAVNDYLLTNEVTADFRESWLKKLRATSKDLGNLDAVIANRRDLVSVHQEYLTAALNTVNQLAGDSYHYLTNYLGLSKGDLEDLRRLYLD